MFVLEISAALLFLTAGSLKWLSDWVLIAVRLL
jgi:hypothetical protein